MRARGVGTAVLGRGPLPAFLTRDTFFIPDTVKWPDEHLSSHTVSHSHFRVVHFHRDWPAQEHRGYLPHPRPRPDAKGLKAPHQAVPAEDLNDLDLLACPDMDQGNQLSISFPHLSSPTPCSVSFNVFGLRLVGL